jgi:gamma-glutamylcyclotransferase (GGCT)/AIG2-like uncharacterized protein YtfP
MNKTVVTTLITKIFCYGTLQEPRVQLDLINRVVTGDLTYINGYVVLRDYVDPSDGIAYPRVVPKEHGCVYGRVLEFTDAEVKILDEYETDMYTLEDITTINGEVVKIYMPNPNYK